MKPFRLARTAAALLALLGCSTYETGPAGPVDDGKTAVFLTDAPFPFDRIQRVDIHIDEIALSPQADTSEGLPTWVTVAQPDQTFNLLDLQNGTTALLGEANVPPGQYRAVRVVFDPDRSSMTDRDGGHPAIDWQAKGDAPSLFSMVEEPMAIDENGEDIVIDFDVGRSFLPDSSSGGFLFIPFLRAITRAGSGGIEGIVVHAESGDPISLAAVSVHYAFDTTSALGPLVATSRTDESGAFKASFLRPGRYTVMPEDLERRITGPARTVEVRAGETAQAGEFEF
jgi:Domain of unknown function (DUF4382)/Carboxypeptidase regulatory-like domain